MTDADLAAVPRLGVTLTYATKALTAAREKLGGREPKTYEVLQQFVLPLTAERRCSLVELLWAQFDARIKAADAAKKKLEKKANPVGEASVFVSHSWGSPFASLVGALEDYLKSHQQPAYAVYFWIDCFSINQHAAAVSTLDSAHWSRLFGEAIRSMGAVCLVATPWESPTALGRCWCLFELMSALSGGDGGDSHGVATRHRASMDQLTAGVRRRLTAG